MNIGVRIRQEREHRHLSQEVLAESLGTTSRSISRWERGQVIPQAYYRLQLCRLFDKSPEELFGEQTGSDCTPQTLLPSIWMIPYTRNPFFLGRDELLSHIATQLKAGQTMALSQPQALSGLGGIGKTQIAIEYAYRHCQEYQIVLWARAESTEALHTSYLQIATTLNLPEKEEKQQEAVVKAVKAWLHHHQQWLLILDNADELPLIKDFLPPIMGGHLLITTRAGTIGRIAQRLEVGAFAEEQGSLFLLRRTLLLPPDAPCSQATEHDQMTAQQIVRELGGLPLALDQAGAYIDETECSLDDYLAFYQTHQGHLLKRRGTFSEDYPQSVASTWSLSFERVEQANPIAADLLRFCAFLSPDAIPEEIITKGSIHLGPLLAPLAENPFLLNEAILALRAYSLINRDAQMHTLSVHRLVQAVLRDSMTIETRKEWKQRTVLAVNKACPDVKDIEQWDVCERWLPHALICVVWIEQEQIKREEAASLLYGAGFCLRRHAQYTEAESLFLRALHIREQSLSSYHPDVAYSLNGLANLYTKQSKYAEAEPLFLRALHIREQSLGPDHPQVAFSLNNLAVMYKEQGKYAEAESLYLRTLCICERNFDPLHPNIARILSNLAELHRERGKYAEAEPLFLHALHILEQSCDPDHPRLAPPLNNLAELYSHQGKYTEAEPLFLRALHIYEQSLSPDHPQVAYPLDGLAGLYHKQGKYAEAKSLFLRALHIYEQSLSPDHPHVAYPLDGLATLYSDQGKYAEAEPLFLRALHIREQSLSPDHHLTRETRKNYALLLRAMKRDEEAKKLEEET